MDVRQRTFFEEVRTCRKCGEAKPPSAFYCRKGKPESRCKSCHIEDNAARVARFTPEQVAKENNHKYQSRSRLKAIPLSSRLSPSHQKCRRCKEIKEIEEFAPSLVFKNGRESRCGPCVREASREAYAAKDPRRQRLKRARDKYRSTEHGQIAQLDYLFRRKYGITAADYFAMLSAQGGNCALCLLPPETKRRLAVDHDHITGKVRGLLCTKCNSALERFDSVPEFFQRASAYLNSPPFTALLAARDCAEPSEAVN